MRRSGRFKNTFYRCFSGEQDIFKGAITYAEELVANEFISEKKPFNEQFFEPLLTRLYKKSTVYDILTRQINSFPVTHFFYDYFSKSCEALSLNPGYQMKWKYNIDSCIFRQD